MIQYLGCGNKRLHNKMFPIGLKHVQTDIQNVRMNSIRMLNAKLNRMENTLQLLLSMIWSVIESLK